MVILLTTLKDLVLVLGILALPLRKSFIQR